MGLFPRLVSPEDDICIGSCAWVVCNKCRLATNAKRRQAAALQKGYTRPRGREGRVTAMAPLSWNQDGVCGVKLYV